MSAKRVSSNEFVVYGSGVFLLVSVIWPRLDPVLAGTGTGESCCDPIPYVYFQSSPASGTSVGDAQALTAFRQPTEVWGLAKATSWLDTGDASAQAAHEGSATIGLKTATCPGWAYAWKASAELQGTADASAQATFGSDAYGGVNALASVSGDLSVSSQKSAVCSTSSGGTVALGVGTEGVSGSWTLASQSLAASGAASSSFPIAGSDANAGSGPEVQVKFTGYVDVNVQATVAWSWGGFPHTKKSVGSATADPKASIVEYILCKGPGASKFTAYRWDTRKKYMQVGETDGPSGPVRWTDYIVDVWPDVHSAPPPPPRLQWMGIAAGPPN